MDISMYFGLIFGTFEVQGEDPRFTRGSVWAPLALGFRTFPTPCELIMVWL